MNSSRIGLAPLAAALAVLSALSQNVWAAQPLVCLIQPSRMAEVGSSVTGVIDHMTIERGDVVKKGQVIAVLRGDVERAALDVAQSRAQAEADVRAAIAALEFAHQSTVRAEDLVKKKFISEQALDKARTEEQVAAQKLAQAREQRHIWAREKNLAQSQLAQRTIVSPLSGIVAERYLSTGERVEDRSVARVVSIHPLHVEVMVPAASFGKVKTGMMATVTPELPGLAPVEAKIILVDKLIDGASNTFRVRLELPNPDHAIPAGPRCKVAFADAAIQASATLAKPASGFSRVSVAAPATFAVAPTPAAALKAEIVADPAALKAVENWRQAWESKDMPRYLAAYTNDFKGDSPSRSAWLLQREQRIQKPESLGIRLRQLDVHPLSDNQLSVQFQQTYQAGSFHAGTRKTLLMVKEQGQWRIAAERAQP
ncbi:MAG: efflux RND transporter periplasmic adaptor subunit [Thiobacillus sp.]